MGNSKSSPEMIVEQGKGEGMGTPYEWTDWSTDEVRTICKLCLNGCGMIVHKTDNGMKLTGDPSNPLSRGYLCLKGRSVLEITSHPDRITHPLRRVGARGSQRWEKVSWEQAISEISSKLGNIIDKYGPESVCADSLPPKDMSVWIAFAKAIGTPNFFRHDHHICFTPQLLADHLTFGNLVTFSNHMQDDVPNMRTVVVWGLNQSQTNPAKGAVVEYARKAGAKVIVVDPRPTPQAETADIWLRIRPGTDAALALGMLNVLIREHLYDTAFVERWTQGFDLLAKRVEEYPPGKVAEITWVDEESMSEAARIIGMNKPASVITFMGPVMGGNSISALRSIGFLPAVTGNIDISGGNLIKIAPRTQRPALPKELLKRQLSADKFPLFSGPNAIIGPPSGHPSDVINAMITGEPYPVKACLSTSNLITAMEDSKRTLEALLNLDLLVVPELFMTPTAEFADYVLPMTWFLESNAVSEQSGLNFIGARKRVIQPRGEAREEGEIALEILRSMGLLDKLPFSNYREYLDWRLQPLDLSFDEFARLGYIVNPNIERKYEKGLLRSDGKPGFNTPSGKLEFHSTILEKYGYDPLPAYREPIPSPYSTPDLFRDYPFIMITGTRSLPFYHGLGLQIRKFRRLHPDPLLEISLSAADRLGVSEGDEVIIEVPGKDEKVYRKAHIVEGLHEDVVCAEGHWYLPEEHDQKERIWNANINVLTSLRDDWDPVIGGSGCRRVLCRIRKG